jgi:hypothetical protein
MIRDIARCDLVIAPLQEGDPFCECKSELKFFDAALVGVPVLASPTASFRDVIQHGVNGFLANGEAEWFGTLQRLALERSTLRRVARTATESAAARFGIAAQDAAVQAVLQACASETRLPFTAVPAGRPAAAPAAAGLRLLESPRPGRPRLAVLLPDIAPGSGGHRKVLTWCHRYARAGGAVSIFIRSSRSDAELRHIVEEHYFTDCGVVRAYADIERIADGVAFKRVDGLAAEAALGLAFDRTEPVERRARAVDDTPEQRVAHRYGARAARRHDPRVGFEAVGAAGGHQ